ncbi:MAG: cytochrome c [Planctomycetota bacterium]
MASYGWSCDRPERRRRLTTTAQAVALVGLIGLALLLPGCDPPKFATEAEVIAVLNQPRTDAEQEALADEGRRMFLRHSCQQCHVVEGATRGAPRLADLYTTQAILIDGSTIERDRSYVIRSILRSNEQVVAGYPQQMTSYRHIPAAEVAALVAYLERYSPPAAADMADTGGITSSAEPDSAPDRLPIPQE